MFGGRTRKQPTIIFDIMSPSAALLLWLLLLTVLFRLDPATGRGPSPALWVPLVWLFIAATRLPSQWLGGDVGGATAEAIEQGNPLDRSIYCALIVLAIGTLMSRSFQYGEFLRRNPALTAFLCFCLLSVLWSDFPLIALKRWFRDLGDYLVILVILSDPRPLEAIRMVLRRLCFLSIPLSIVFIKYYPQLGIHYSFWTGAPEYVGASTSKNTLGALCLISILIFYWDTALRWHNRTTRETKRIVAINAAFLVMTLWLLHLSNSDTSLVCAVIGCFFISAISSRWGRRYPGLLKMLMPGSFILYLTLDLGFDMNGQFARELGRNPNLTGRTEIWHNLLSLHTNPLLGTGYESFWLGPRLTKIWSLCGYINEAHNGYLDIYLNLGLIGLALLLIFLVSSYRTVCNRLDRKSGLASFGAAIWTLLLFYSVTEAAFKNGMIWMVFLLATAVVPPALKLRGSSSATDLRKEPVTPGIREAEAVLTPRAAAVLR